jgi:pantoate--beta-alanine ligase
MKFIYDIKQMQRWAERIRLKGKTVGFVPTMGYLHQGHLSLIARTKKENDFCLVSIFVNPTQFGPREDFKKYPRDIKRDERLCRKTGVDVIFYPQAQKMYSKNYLTYVNVEKWSELLCGASRPGHFRGVTTVVSKLFNIVKPHIAYFGQKDAQQAMIIKKMTDDLNFDVKVKVLPTVREKNGLAMSSRNVYLSKEERQSAVILYQALCLAKKMVSRRVKDVQKIISAMRQQICQSPFAKIDYIAITDENLLPLERISHRVLIVLAVYIGKTRLIDNIIVGVRPARQSRSGGHP